MTLGLLEADASLLDLLEGLYGEGVIGFFDTEEEKLHVVMDSAAGFGPYEARTFAHEFAHSLQQQHFDIHSTSEDLEGHSERSRAFEALVEGDATISETIYVARHFDEEEQIALAEASSSVPADAFSAAPHVIQRAFMFPYTYGTSFAVSLLLTSNSWDLVNRALEEPPLIRTLSRDREG